MAGAGMNDIKSRIKSVSGTMQITKAMELVATSKLRRAKLQAERSRPFRAVLDEAICDLLSSSDIGSSVWASKPESKKELFVVIAGDRGLAGGYNANIFRLTEALSQKGESVILPIGKKALEYYKLAEDMKPDNLTLTFSPALVDFFIYVIDVAAGDKIPRKDGPGISHSDILVINKTDLAPYVHASLDVMREDSIAMRGDKPFVFTNCFTGEGIDTLVEMIEQLALFDIVEQ